MIFLRPAADQCTDLVFANSANVFDFDVHLDWIHFAKSDARLSPDPLVWPSRHNLDWLFDHAAFIFAGNVA